MCESDDLPGEFVPRIEAYRCMGTSIKINLAVRELPYVKGLPEDGVQPYHTGIMEMNPFVADMDYQQAQAVQGIAADPAHIEVCFPTVHDPSLPPGQTHHDDRRELPAVPPATPGGTTSRRVVPTARSPRWRTLPGCPI
jgi:phytoene dehydrogenase-like protein